MYKGMYVLLPMSELRVKITKYLGIENFHLITQEEQHDDIVIESSEIALCLPKEDKAKMLTILNKIIGPEEEHLIEDLTFDYEIGKTVTLDMTECSYMLSQLFEIHGKVKFDNEVTLANEDEDVYLYYVHIENKEKIDHGQNCKNCTFPCIRSGEDIVPIKDYELEKMGFVICDDFTSEQI